MLLTEPQPVSDLTKAALRHWWGDDIYDNTGLDRVLTGSQQWDVLWHGAMMKAASGCETRLIGVALSLYQSEIGDPAPFPSFEQLVEDTGFNYHDMTWAIPSLISHGLVVVNLPPAPPTAPSGREPRRKAPIPKELRWFVWERDNFTCLGCGSRRNLSIDHIEPESLGGPTVAENLQTLCTPCNSAKGARREPVVQRL